MTPADILRHFTLPFMIVLLAGCATLSEEECQSADWYLIGLEDGSQGYTIERLGSHRKACADIGISPEVDEYRQGLREGYKTYCRASNGYRLGRSGGTYADVCSGASQRDFTQAYRLGRDLYRLDQAVADLEQQIAQNRSDLEQLDEDTQFHEDQLVYEAQTPAERQRHLQAIKANENEAGALEQNLIYLERERSVLARDLDDMEHYHHQLGY